MAKVQFHRIDAANVKELAAAIVEYVNTADYKPRGEEVEISINEDGSCYAYIAKSKMLLMTDIAIPELQMNMRTGKERRVRNVRPGSSGVGRSGRWTNDRRRY